MKALRVALAALLALCLAAGMAAAHGPSRQKVTQSVVLNATPAEVWAVIGQFGDLSWYPRARSVQGPAEVAKGAQRVVVWANGETTTEELTKFSPETRSYSYRSTADNIAALPVTNYSGILTVKEEGGKARVEWTGAFYRGHPNNDPPPELNDEAAVAAVTAAHATGLEALADRFGTAP